MAAHRYVWRYVWIARGAELPVRVEVERVGNHLLVTANQAIAGLGILRAGDHVAVRRGTWQKYNLRTREWIDVDIEEIDTIGNEKESSHEIP